MPWLLFFPNAPYIFTDLLHLRLKLGMPTWFDLLLIFSFAWNGLILGYLSLMDMEHLVAQKFNRLAACLFSLAALAGAAFGIYLGRFLRWNSWDILTDPFALALDIGHRLLHPFQHPRTLGFTLACAALLIGGYATLHILAQAQRQRLEA